MIRAVVVIEIQEDELQKWLDGCYAGPPDDPAPDRLEWAREVLEDTVPGAFDTELGHVGGISVRIESVERQP